VGPLTKIILYNEQQSLEIPHLWEPMAIPNDVTGAVTGKKMIPAKPEKGLPDPGLMDI
jgi:hypothetical protein